MKIQNRNLNRKEVKNFVEVYKENIHKNKESRQNLIVNMVPKNCRVLDYGCGWGALSKLLEEQGNTVVGIDRSSNDIEICKAVWGINDKLRFEKKEIFQIESSTFDCVISTQVIEHVHNVGNYLNHCNRVLKKNGYLVISLPNIMNPRFLFKNIFSEKYLKKN